MQYAVSCHGKLYILEISTKNDVAYEIRKKIEEKLGRKIIAYDFIEIHGQEYEANDLPVDHPDKWVFFYDDRVCPRREFRFPNKDIIYLD